MTTSLKTLAAMAISAAFLSAFGCKETELPVPSVPHPTTQQPAPGTTTNLPIEQIPPVEQAPATPSLPSVPGQLRRLTWAPLDYKEFEYNAQGGLLKYNRQYNSVQGTDIVNRDEYTYSYDASGKVTSVSNQDGFRTEYSYSGNVWSEALSYDKLNRPLRKYRFQFDANKRLTEYTEYNVSLEGMVSPRSRTAFTYDAAGNLTRYTYFWYVEGSQSFVRSTELQFSNFDTKKYPKNADSFGDHVLQPLTFFVNNPGKKEILSSYHPVEYYAYSYDVHGYPTRKRTSYTYDKPLPAMEATFDY
ncbi:RHS repeat protein [Flavihumibacter sp. R14]|nr:RHS repeat protein [Flavihumibacter soli]